VKNIARRLELKNSLTYYKGPYQVIDNLVNVYLPKKFADVAASDVPLKLFGPKELDQLNRIFNHLRNNRKTPKEGESKKIT